MFKALKQIKKDINAIFERDPAVDNIFEVLLAYSGLHAIIFHRFSHFLYKLGLRTIPRLISQIARFFTGIEIHPGAEIGDGFFIDHGMGVVIGETTEIGDEVTIYQGVTLGGTGKERGKRHPTIEDNVIIGSGAKILGSINIGKNVKVGAGSVVLDDVESNATVVGVPGRVVIKDGERIYSEMDLGDVPDPVGDRIEIMEECLEKMKEKVNKKKNYSRVG